MLETFNTVKWFKLIQTRGTGIEPWPRQWGASARHRSHRSCSARCMYIQYTQVIFKDYFKTSQSLAWKHIQEMVNTYT